MKKQTRQMLVLLGVLAACVVCYFAVSRYLAHQQANQPDDTVTLGALTDQVTQVTLAGSGQELAFTLEGDSWTYSDPAFPVDQEAITQLTDLLAPITAQRAMSLSDSLDAYGLASPTVTLTAADSQGNTLTLLLGTANANGDYYAMEQGGDTVYVLDSTLASYLSRGLYDFMALETFDPMDEDNVTALTLVADGGAPMVLTRETVTSQGEDGQEETDYVWSLDGTPLSQLSVSDAYLASLDEGDEAAGLQTLLDDAVDALSDLSFSRCVDYQADPSLLLGSSPAGTPLPLELTVDYTGEDGDARQTTLRVGAQNEDGQRLAMKDDSSFLYILAVNRAQPLLTLALAL